MLSLPKNGFSSYVFEFEQTANIQGRIDEQRCDGEYGPRGKTFA